MCKQFFCILLGPSVWFKRNGGGVLHRPLRSQVKGVPFSLFHRRVGWACGGSGLFELTQNSSRRQNSHLFSLSVGAEVLVALWGHERPRLEPAAAPPSGEPHPPGALGRFTTKTAASVALNHREIGGSKAVPSKETPFCMNGCAKWSLFICKIIIRVRTRTS